MKQKEDTLFKNRFAPEAMDAGYVDCYSHLVVTFLRNTVGIDALCTRGLNNIRGQATAPSLQIKIKATDWPSAQPLTASGVEHYPWGVTQSGEIRWGNCAITGKLRITCPRHNLYLLELALAGDGYDGDLELAFDGRWFADYAVRKIENQQDAVAFAVGARDAKNDRFFSSGEDWCACWRLSAPGRPLACQPLSAGYRLQAGGCSLKQPQSVLFLLDMENRPPKQAMAWGELPAASEFNAVWGEAQNRFCARIAPLPGRERPSYSREVRAAAILDRTGYLGVHGRWGQSIASFCMATDWASTAFFWDSIFGAIGLGEFSPRQAEDALRVLYAFQRPDGCVPTHSYEYEVGSTFYPQAPLEGWGILHLYRRWENLGFVREILPRVRGVFDWYLQTQDHDRDGLIEVRFTGQSADNSPQYDRYMAHLSCTGFSGCCFLPPVASVAYNSYIYMEARCLSKLYRLVGDDVNAAAVMAAVDAIPQRLLDVCWDRETGYFHDYDHQCQAFNRVRVLTSLLPVWAGMPLPDEVKQTLLKDNALNPQRFFGPQPFPYVAYDDPQYDPCGYWRGRIWPHTTTWILEMLWANGYRRQADDAADRLLAMIDRGDKILECYFSDPQRPGGGSPDYQWSAAVYLYLTNRRYRENIL
jgi:hypothetical protein